MITKPIYGLMAEFDNPTALVAAARAARETGYRKLDAYSPFPIEELNDALHLHKNKLPLIVLVGGIAGAILGYLLQYYITVVDYPLNIGGRPLHSWPSYIVITFELTILLAALSTVLGLFALCGLPTPYHPVFNVARFSSTASRNRFFLCIEANDPMFDPERTAGFLETFQPKEVCEVAH
jgi:ActD protein